MGRFRAYPGADIVRAARRHGAVTPYAGPVSDSVAILGAIYGDEDDIDADLRGFLPPAVALRPAHYAPLPPDADVLSWVRWMAASPGIEAAAERLAPFEPAAVIYPINSFSAIDGPAGAARISRRISSSAGGAP